MDKEIKVQGHTVSKQWKNNSNPGQDDFKVLSLPMIFFTTELQGKS